MELVYVTEIRASQLSETDVSLAVSLRGTVPPQAPLARAVHDSSVTAPGTVSTDRLTNCVCYSVPCGLSFGVRQLKEKEPKGCRRGGWIPDLSRVFRTPDVSWMMAL